MMPRCRVCREHVSLNDNVPVIIAGKVICHVHVTCREPFVRATSTVARSVGAAVKELVASQPKLKSPLARAAFSAVQTFVESSREESRD